MGTFSIPDSLKVANVSRGATTDLNTLYSAVRSIAGIDVLNTTYSGGADETGVTDSTAAIQAALNACSPGDFVYMPNGIYKTTSVLTIPNGVSLHGPTRMMAYPGGNYGIGGVPFQGAIIRPTGSMTAAVQFASSGSTQYGNQAIRRIVLDGTNVSSGTGHGILADAVAGVTLEDVSVFDFLGDGLHGVAVSGTGSHPPDFWTITRCKFSGCGGNGVNLQGCADSFITDSEATGNAGAAGWNLVNGNNMRLVGCKAEFNINGFGWLLTAQSGFGGLVHMLCCTSQFNKKDGFNITGTGTGIYNLMNCASDTDGLNGGSGGGSYAGLNVNGFAGTVVADQFVTRVTGSPASPQYGVSMATSNRLTMLGSVLDGATKTVNDGGSNTLLRVDGGEFDRFPSAQQMGIAAWSYPSILAVGGTAAASSGVVYVIRVPLTGGKTPITNVLLAIQTGGSTLTSGQSFVGVYDSAGTKIGGSADQASSWTSTGLKTIALTSGPFNTSSPFVYVVIMSNGTTPPAFARLGGGSAIAPLSTLSSSGSKMPFATNGTGTALPSSLTYSSNSATGAQGFWVGLS